MKTSNEIKGIHEAILHVYSQIGYVQKLGKNAIQKYNYAAEADLISALRPAMIEASIIIFPLKIERHNEVLTDNGKTRFHVSNLYTFRFVHTPSGTFIDVQSTGEGVGNDDKSSYKAATGAMKYAIRQAFMIETGDDPDQDIKSVHSPQRKEEVYKETSYSIPINLLEDDSGPDWKSYSVELINAIEKIQTKEALLAFKISNLTGLAKLEKKAPNLHSQVSDIARKKMQFHGWGARKPSLISNVNNVNGQAHA